MLGIKGLPVESNLSFLQHELESMNVSKQKFRLYKNETGDPHLKLNIYSNTLGWATQPTMPTRTLNPFRT